MPYKDPEKYKKNQVICRWRRKGLLVEDYNIIYDKWINTNKCDYCNIELQNGQKGLNKKCMEHNHQNHQFRSICCRNCNGDMLDKKGKKHLKNVYYHSRDNLYSYIKTHKGIKYHIDCGSKALAIWVKLTHYLILRQSH